MENRAAELLNDYANAESPTYIEHKIIEFYERDDYQSINDFTDFFLQLDEPGISDKRILYTIGTTIAWGKKKPFISIINKISNAYLNNGVFTNVKNENFLYSWMAHVDLTLITDNRIIHNNSYKINYVKIFSNIITNKHVIKYIMHTPEFLELRKRIIEDGKVDEIEDIFVFLMKDRYSMSQFYEGISDEYQLGVRI